MDNQNRPAWNTAEKTQLKWFLLIAYGLTAVMGAVLLYALHGLSHSVRSVRSMISEMAYTSSS